MSNDRELLQAALYALEDIAEAGSDAWGRDRPCVEDAYGLIDALRARLAQPEVNYQDLYEKEKRRSEMWASKYVSACGEQLVIELAQPEQEQEPVAWLSDQGQVFFDKKEALRWADSYIEPLYTAPQLAAQPVLCKSEVKRLAIQMGLFEAQPVPLTDEQIGKLITSELDEYDIARAIEAAHNIKEN